MQILPTLQAFGTLLAIALATGCGPAHPSPATPGGAGEAKPLVVGTEAAYPPFESVEPNGDIVGLDVDLVRALGERLGRPVTVRNMQFDALIPELQAGRIDIVASGMSRLPERALKVDFSRPYARIIMSILLSTTRAADVKSAADLDKPGVVIAVQRGTSGEVKAKAAFSKAEIRPFDNQVDASKEVAAGRAHAFVYDMVSVRKLAEKEPDKLRVLGETLGSEEYCMAFAKGSALVDPANAFLDDAAKPDGLLSRLVAKWKPDAESAPADAK
ncbi:MAG: transporter substrate-binding domain-containing protein [Planctomycetes bacterium]|nr:transporter substrate-binding domain-containing protein [Planctomycetota bacterium]